MPTNAELQQALNLLQAFEKSAPEFINNLKRILPTLDSQQFEKAFALIKAEKQKLDSSLSRINKEYLGKLNEFTVKHICQAFLAEEKKISAQEKQKNDQMLSELS